MKINCIVIDGSLSTLQVMEETIKSLARLQLQQTFTDVWSAAAYVRQNPVDLLFIDPALLGPAGLKQFSFKEEEPVIIYLTDSLSSSKGLPDEALRLPKPIQFGQFFEVATTAIAQWEERQAATDSSGNALFVRSNYRFVKVDLNEIEYIESASNYLKIILSNGKCLMTLMAFKDLLSRLPKESFIRIHRSYVVAVKKVRWIGSRRLKLNEVELPISNSYKEQIRDLLQVGI